MIGLDFQQISMDSICKPTVKKVAEGRREKEREREIEREGEVKHVCSESLFGEWCFHFFLSTKSVRNAETVDDKQWQLCKISVPAFRTLHHLNHLIDIFIHVYSCVFCVSTKTMHTFCQIIACGRLTCNIHIAQFVRNI